MNDRKERGRGGKKGAVAIYVDNVDLSPGSRHSDRLDYRSLINLARSEYGVVVRSRVYIQVDTNEGGQAGDQNFAMVLQDHGYEVKMLKVIRRPDGSVKWAKWSAGIAVDVLNDCHESEWIDTVIIGSGDGDMAPVAQDLRMKGIRVVIVGFPDLTSSRLKKLADRYVPIEGDLVLNIKGHHQARAT